MSLTNKIDTRMLSIVLIAFIGGVIGGYISNAALKDTQIEGLSNALTTQLISKDTEIATLRDTMSMLEEQVSQLEGTVAYMESATVIGFNTPDFDSGWIVIEPASTVYIHHNLGTNNLFVYLLGGYGEGSELVTHQHSSGGDEYVLGTLHNNEWEFEWYNVGTEWYANSENTINVYRRSTDMMYRYTRVLIWVLPDPPELTTP